MNKLCCKCKISERAKSSWYCRVCTNEKNRKSYQNNQQKVKSRVKQYYLKNRLKILKKQKEDLNKKYDSIKFKAKYKNNREKYIMTSLYYQKKNNYASSKIEKQRTLRNIKRKTRNKYSLDGQICISCGFTATEHHHTTQPIAYNAFVFTCHDCHIEKTQVLNLLYEEKAKAEKRFVREERIKWIM